ncbi:glycosyl transferase family 1 [Cohnella kolymensis]|uniref:Glycosyl transferase family 1 n=1 Tax=Cohnella kolymensis TaxID=1590652 RepID=A0ABR5A354_9BACL|nr:glycosyltransferase family 4 protein [Cohnella kolymensis]KIL35464.1 glycosyl transferase family 1 [Cohnella kolymensis]
MSKVLAKSNVAFLGTSLPRECGLATFTQDLFNELEQFDDMNTPRVIAIDNNSTYTYGKQVMMHFNQNLRPEYIKAALELNRSDTDVLIIQHEFGIYGGESGEYVLDLAERLQIPFIVIFHTVLSTPSPKQLSIVKRLAELSFKAVTMSQSTIPDLLGIYGVAAEKVCMIHHGVPALVTASREELKKQYGCTDRKIISTFGFLSPGKGIEYAIEAMSGVTAKHPDAIYMIWGKTHPNVKQESGEVYRESLIDLVGKLNLQNNVRFINRLLTQEEIVQSLVLSDIYVTPYLGKDQAVSGTLAYGVGYGRVIVSTPYRYAKEMLAEGRGLIADFRDAASLETCILEILDHPERQIEMEQRTHLLGRTIMWNQIAKQYAALIRESISSPTWVHGSVI